LVDIVGKCWGRLFTVIIVAQSFVHR
jgi:hypothetical protein